VNLIITQSTEGSVALETTIELVEDRCSECDFSCAVKVQDGFERTGFTGVGRLLFAEDEFVE
jgi:hypothetical protein